MNLKTLETMKNNIFKLSLFLLGITLFMTSCDPEGITPDPTVGDPAITGTNTPTAALEAGSEFTFNITATPSTDNPLKTIDFTEGNELIALERIKIDGNAAPANPILLFGDDKNGVNWEVTIAAHSDPGVKQYSANVIDDANNDASFQFDVETNVVLPTITADAPAEINVGPDALLEFDVEFAKGTNDIKSFAIYQNGALIEEYSRMAYNDLANVFDANPYLVPESDKAGASVSIYLRSQATPSTDDYKFVVADTDDNVAEFEFKITTATPVAEVTGVLFNSAGPAGTGGLDLDEGVGTGSSDALAEIKDEGIDTDMPFATNWIKRISGVNGSELRELVAGQNGLAEDFSYDNVASKETVAAVFDSGAEFTATNSNGNLISNVVTVGSTFSVKNGDNYYLIIIREVNETDGDNGDNYKIDIKK